jgi:hypothetical protein
MSLTNVWVETHSDGLVRADHVIGIEAHTTAGLRDTPSHWLLDVVLATSVGSGFREGWNVTALHRTLAQTARAPEGSSVALAQLLARLDVMSATGVISIEKANSEDHGSDALSTSAGGIRFRFQPFRTPVPDDRTDGEYL